MKQTGFSASNGVVEPLREQDLFVAVHAVEKTHAGIKLQECKKVSRCSEQGYSLQNIAFSHSLAQRWTNRLSRG